ncbi:MAG: hypothetical protein Q7S04_00945 [Candidatus Moranbacteria bacterium]|nr:hypothetical protein [Candidatus Moranbacteria bacterium]
MMGFEEEQNYLRETRLECASCHRFAWGNEMIKDGSGKRHHPDCLARAKAKRAENKAPVIQLVPREEVSSTPDKEQLAA